MPPLSPVPLVSEPVRFLVGQDQEGHWVARDGRGLVGGLFATRDSALRFAAFESDRRADIVILTPLDRRLTLGGALPIL